MMIDNFLFIHHDALGYTFVNQIMRFNIMIMKNIFRHLIFTVIIFMGCTSIAFASNQTADKSISEMKQAIDARNINTDINLTNSFDNKRIETGQTAQEKR